MYNNRRLIQTILNDVYICNVAPRIVIGNVAIHLPMVNFVRDNIIVVYFMY